MFQSTIVLFYHVWGKMKWPESVGHTWRTYRREQCPAGHGLWLLQPPLPKAKQKDISWLTKRQSNWTADFLACTNQPLVSRLFFWTAAGSNIIFLEFLDWPLHHLLWDSFKFAEVTLTGLGSESNIHHGLLHLHSLSRRTQQNNRAC